MQISVAGKWQPVENIPRLCGDRSLSVSAETVAEKCTKGSILIHFRSLTHRQVYTSEQSLRRAEKSWDAESGATNSVDPHSSTDSGK